MQRLKTGGENIRGQVFDMLNHPIITDPGKRDKKRGCIKTSLLSKSPSLQLPVARVIFSL
jgi:hypothetical protein